MNFVLCLFLLELTIAQHLTPRWGPRLPRIRRPPLVFYRGPRFYRRVFWYRHPKPPIPPGHFAYPPVSRFPVRHLAHQHASQPFYHPPPSEPVFHFKPQIGLQSNIHQLQNGEQAWQGNPVGEQTNVYKYQLDGSLPKGYVDPLITKKPDESQLEKDNSHVTNKENEALNVAGKENLVASKKKAESLENGPYDKWLQMYKARHLFKDEYSRESEDVDYDIPQLNTYPGEKTKERSWWRTKRDSADSHDKYSGRNLEAVETETYESAVPKKFYSKIKVGGNNMAEEMYKNNMKEAISDFYNSNLQDDVPTKKMHVKSFPLETLTNKDLDFIRRHTNLFEDRGEKYSKIPHKQRSTLVDYDDSKLSKLFGHNIPTGLYRDEQQLILHGRKSPFGGNKAQGFTRTRSHKKLLKENKPHRMKKVKDIGDTFEYLNTEYLAPKSFRKRKASMKQLSKHVRGRSRSTVYVDDNTPSAISSEKLPSKFSDGGKNNHHRRSAKNIRSAFAEYGRHNPVEVIEEEEEYVENHAVDIGPTIPLTSYSDYYY